jgi:predicted nucleic acid-binding Zn ribbon protein
VSSEGPGEHINVYRRIRRAFGDPALRSPDARRRRRSAAGEHESVPYGPGREPQGLGDVLGALSTTMGWESPLARAELLLAWPHIVGAETAAHTEPVGIEAGILTVRCDSTAWAQQLRTMTSAVLVNITERHAAAGIETVRFIGPDTPSWKRGPRAIPGRGPRDTYG